MNNLYSQILLGVDYIESNKKLYKIVLSIIVILVIFSLVIINYFKLEEAVFFKHYFDIRAYNEDSDFEEMPFILRYITSVDDTRTVSRISFSDYPEAVIQSSEHGYMNALNAGYESSKSSIDSYGRYSIRTIFCNIKYLPDDAYEDSIIRKITVIFDDGSELSVDIGELHLYKAEDQGAILQSDYSYSDSDGISRIRFDVLENINFESIESPLLNEFSDLIVLKVNDGKPEEAIATIFERGQQMNIESQVKPRDDRLKDYRLFDIHPKFVFTEENGERHSIRIMNINNLYNNDYSSMDLYRYIKEGEL